MAGESVKAQLDDFTDRALANVGGRAPSSWGGSARDGGVSSTALITVAVVLVAGATGPTRWCGEPAPP